MGTKQMWYWSLRKCINSLTNAFVFFFLSFSSIVTTNLPVNSHIQKAVKLVDIICSWLKSSIPFIVFHISLMVIIYVWQNALFLSILAQIFDNLEHVIIQVMLKFHCGCFSCSVQQNLNSVHCNLLMIFMLLMPRWRHQPSRYH